MSDFNQKLEWQFFVKYPNNIFHKNYCLWTCYIGSNWQTDKVLLITREMNVRKHRKEKCRKSNSDHPAHSPVTKLTTSPHSPTTIIFIFILGIYFPTMSVRTSMHTTYQWIRKGMEGSGRGLTWGVIVTYMARLRKSPKTLVLLRAAISTQDLINVKQKSTHWEVTFGQTANWHQTRTLENKRLDVIKMHWNVSGYSEYLTKHSYEVTHYMWVSSATRRAHRDYTWCQCVWSWTILWNAISENEPRVTESCTAMLTT